MADPKATKPLEVQEVEQLEGGDLLDQIIDTGIRAGDETARERGQELIRNLVDQLVSPDMVVAKSIVKTINSRIAAIDALLSRQLDEIVHAPEFQKLEGSWRSLNQLIMNTETGENLKIRVLNISKKDMLRDFQAAAEFTESGLWKKVYEYEFGVYGGDPFGALLGPLFYVLIALAALTSTMSLLEVVTSYIIDEHGVDRRKATLMCGGAVFVFTILAALSFGAAPALSGFSLFEGKSGWFENADHFVSNWMLPTGGLAITIAAGWVMTRTATESELMDGTQPSWFRYGAWRFFIRYVAPAAVAAIIIAVMFFGADFS